MTEDIKKETIAEVEENSIEPSSRLKKLLEIQKENADQKKLLEEYKKRIDDYEKGNITKDKADKEQDINDNRPVTDDEIDTRVIHDDLAYDVPQHLKNKYERSATGIYVDIYQQKEAFRDKGKTLKTPKTDLSTIRDMLDVAETKGWTELALKGNKEFKRLTFLEAESRGFRTTGYKPTIEDLTLLNRMRDERSQNMIEPQQSTNQEASQGMNDPETQQQQDRGTQHGTASSERDYDEPEILHPVLIDHGAAPYKFDDKENLSYYVRVQMPNGDEKDIWGVGLKDALENSQARVGDEVELKNLGRQPVTVNRSIYNENGEVVRVEPFETLKNKWEITNHSKNVDLETEAEAQKEAREERQKESLLAGDKAEARAQNTKPTYAQIEQSPLADSQPVIQHDAFTQQSVPAELNAQLNKTTDAARNNPSQKYASVAAKLTRDANKIASRLDARIGRQVMRNFNENLEKALNGQNGGIPLSIQHKYERENEAEVKQPQQDKPETDRTRNRGKERDMSM
ncbi:hypothetical protein CEQ07_03835 [Oligella urethralis]|uniref:LPD7 domain-containing protein n=1 Tax=Oligella urethralis TaxID=90245 RepID=UPI000CFE8F65|nr:LPD7 domain-containing protein [Oligella urethralis]AVL70634.1 hypothetical protein CEQ07_03835 [Oligella urethralis]